MHMEFVQMEYFNYLHKAINAIQNKQLDVKLYNDI